MQYQGDSLSIKDALKKIIDTPVGKRLDIPVNSPVGLIFSLKARYVDKNGNEIKFPETEKVQGGYLDTKGNFHKDEE